MRKSMAGVIILVAIIVIGIVIVMTKSVAMKGRSEESASMMVMSQKILTNEERMLLVDTARSYEAKLIAYLNAEKGGKEWALKMNLRDAYLKCDATYDQIIVSTKGYGTEIGKMISEWDHKVEKGILVRGKPAESLEDFGMKAYNYSKAYMQAVQIPEFKSYNTANAAYKDEVIKLVKKGVSEKDILATLRKNGITDERVLALVPYWAEKKE